MAVYTQVRTALRNSAIAALQDYPAVPIIFSNSNGTEPAESYVVISISSINQQGHHSTSSLLNTANEIVFSVAYEVFVQYSFIGSMSGELAQAFTQNINNNPLTRQALQGQKLGFMRKSQVRRAPQLRDTKWVEYHNMDVTFNYVVVSNQAIDPLEGVVIEQDISDGETTDTITIKIPDTIVYP